MVTQLGDSLSVCSFTVIPAKLVPAFAGMTAANNVRRHQAESLPMICSQATGPETANSMGWSQVVAPLQQANKPRHDLELSWIDFFCHDAL